jgi:hypothetical protein
MNKILLASFLIASATIATPVHALVNIIGTETGGNVEFSYSGSLNTGGLTSGFTASQSVVRGSDAFLFFASGFVVAYNSAISGPLSFGTGLATFTANSRSGDFFGIVGNNSSLYLPIGYVSNTNISGLMTFDSATFASLGITPGTYTYTLTNAAADTINLNIGVTPVPFEFSPALGLGVLGGLVAAKKLSGKFFKK